MKEKKKITAVLMTVTLALSLMFTSFTMPSYAASSNGFTYDIEDGGATITDYSRKAPKDVVIPETLGGKPVKKIGNSAFYDKHITSVTIPEGVVEIERYAFNDNELKSLTLPSTLQKIGSAAFFQNQLTSVTLNEGLKTISPHAFGVNKIEQITIPSTVETIENSAFFDNKLTSLTLNDGLKTIGYNAFSWNSLTEVTIPSSVTNIGDFTFLENPNLAKITFAGNSVTLGTGSLGDVKWYTEDAYTNVFNPAGGVKAPMTIYAKSGSSAEFGEANYEDGRYKGQSAKPWVNVVEVIIKDKRIVSIKMIKNIEDAAQQYAINILSFLKFYNGTKEVSDQINNKTPGAAYDAVSSATNGAKRYVEAVDNAIKKPAVTTTNVTLTPNAAEITKGTAFTLPAKATAIISDGSEEKVDIKWDKTPDVNTIGTQEFTGTVPYWTENLTFTLTVKEKPTISNVTLTPNAAKITQGGTFTLPTKATATMSDNSTEQVDVTWNKEPDVNAVGPQEFTGTVTGWTGSLTFTLTVKAKPTISNVTLTPNAAEITQGTAFTLPAKATATMSDASTKEVDVTWDKTPDVNAVGPQEFTGTVTGWTENLTFTLTVKAKPGITNVTLTPNAAEITQGTAFTLPAKATATLADNSTEKVDVTWNKEPNVNTVGPQEFTGTVTGWTGSLTFTLTVKEKPAPTVLYVELEKNTAEITQGDSFTLPTKATATMSDDSTKEVAVTWNKEPDVNTVGTQEFIGTVAEWDAGELVFTLIVNKKTELTISNVTLTPNAAEITQGSAFTLPAKATATMSDDSTKEVDVTWNKEPDINVVGTQEFTGTVTGWTGSLTFTLTVKADSEEINKEKLEKLVEESSKLVEEQYTSESWAPFKVSLDAAKNTLKESNPTQEAIVQSYNNLNAAKNSLKLMEKEYTIKVIGGSASKTRAKAGEIISIESYFGNFLYWRGNVNIVDKNSARTQFTMPERNVEIEGVRSYNSNSSSNNYNTGSNTVLPTATPITAPTTVSTKQVTKITIGSKTLKKTLGASGTTMEMDVEAYIKDNRTMLPLRYLGEALGFEVSWDQNTRTATLKNKDTIIKIPVDGTTFTVNGKEYKFDSAPEMKNNRIMLAISNIAKALGLEEGKDIIWDANTKEVTISKTLNN